jgi:hypothetical protein
VIVSRFIGRATPAVWQRCIKKRAQLLSEFGLFRRELEAQSICKSRCLEILSASASDRQARNCFYDARNAVHSVADQIANAWKIVGLCDSDYVEWSGDYVDVFHHRNIF